MSTAASGVEYRAARSHLAKDVQAIIMLEQHYMDFLVSVTLEAARDLYRDFGRANDLIPYWNNYSPKQRGRKPTGESIPWAEVGEKSLSSNLLRAIWQKDPSITFPGLPFGGDVRFATNDAIIHFDVKMTGPNDNPNEVVVPPQQVSGDGFKWKNGVVNSPVKVKGQRADMVFQPKLPPFYVMDEQVRVCLTYFLKAVYSVEAKGNQPLQFLEVACLPNGLLLFDGPRYAQTVGLLIPGKDDRSKAPEDKRIRVRLDPLVSLEGNWRCVKIVNEDGTWQRLLRGALPKN